MKRILTVTAACGTFVIALYVLVTLKHYFELGVLPGTPYVVYDPSDLAGKALPIWNGTNAVPLEPNAAAEIALKYLNTTNTNSSHWKVKQVKLNNEFGNIWCYDVGLLSDGPSRPDYEVVRVLMNGEVWQPRHHTY